jgi:23S rRNA pseudouridine1911/1915/1917 synthase
VENKQAMKLSDLQVLYEDNHCIAVYKPAGVLVQGDASGAASLMEYVKEYLKEKYNKPGNVFLGLAHRLDRKVSGIVLFAKTSKGAARLSEQFRDHTTSKIYNAIVHGIPKEKTATLINYLEKNEAERKAYVFNENTPDDKRQRAVLSYEVIKTDEGEKQALVRIELKTGRFHQIRAQLSNIGNPIIGDTKYGAPKALKDGSIMLQASELSFMPPTGEIKINLVIGLPDGWEI